MRLFDKCLTQTHPEAREMLRRLATETTVLAVDAIAEHYATNDQLLWGPEDYPYCIPPWKNCFVEWREPRYTKTEIGVVESNGRSQAGAMVSCIASTRQDAERVWSGLLNLSRGHIIRSDASELALHPDADRCASMTFFMDGLGATVCPMVMTFAFLNSSGMVRKRFTTGVGLQKFIDTIGGEESFKYFDSLAHIVWLSFTFSNCANVKLEDVTEDLQPPVKIRRRLKIPEVKRYTLNIAGHVARPSRDYNEGPQGAMPFHLCRGHFATYTADKPMFGNPKLVGRYWHPPHMKGKKEQGEIVKDYAIDG